MVSNHPFARYFRKHGHYPRVRLDNGTQRILVEFAPGYLRVKTYPRGGEVYIVRSTWINLLRRVIPLTRKWSTHPDFDLPEAMHQNYLQEMAHLDALRQEKRARHRGETLDDVQRRERQRKRWLKARARATRRQFEDGATD